MFHKHVSSHKWWIPIVVSHRHPSNQGIPYRWAFNNQKRRRCVFLKKNLITWFSLKTGEKLCESKTKITFFWDPLVVVDCFLNLWFRCPISPCGSKFQGPLTCSQAFPAMGKRITPMKPRSKNNREGDRSSGSSWITWSDPHPFCLWISQKRFLFPHFLMVYFWKDSQVSHLWRFLELFLFFSSRSPPVVPSP